MGSFFEGGRRNQPHQPIELRIKHSAEKDPNIFTTEQLDEEIGTMLMGKEYELSDVRDRIIRLREKGISGESRAMRRDEELVVKLELFIEKLSMISGYPLQDVSRVQERRDEFERLKKEFESED